MLITIPTSKFNRRLPAATRGRRTSCRRVIRQTAPIAICAEWGGLDAALTDARSPLLTARVAQAIARFQEATDRPYRTADRRGLESLVSAAISEMQQAVYQDGYPQLYQVLPYNLHIHGPAVHMPNSRKFADPDGAYIAAYARFAGWLRAIAADPDSYPCLIRAIQEGQSPRGCGSPATRFNLWNLAARLSPGAAERKIRAILPRAAEILRGFGLSPCWACVGAALEKGSLKRGKAAFRLAGATLGKLFPNIGRMVRPQDLARAAGTAWFMAEIVPAYDCLRSARKVTDEVASLMASERGQPWFELPALAELRLELEARTRTEAQRANYVAFALGRVHERKPDAVLADELFGLLCELRDRYRQRKEAEATRIALQHAFQRGPEGQALALAEWRKEGLLPQVPGLPGYVLCWKYVRPVTEPPYFQGLRGMRYKTGAEFACNGEANACAGPMGALRDWSHNSQESHLMALAVPISGANIDGHSHGVLTYHEGKVLALYTAALSPGDQECILTLVEGEDVLPLIQEDQE